MRRILEITASVVLGLYLLAGMAYLTLNLLLFFFVRITPYPDQYIWHPFLTTVHRPGAVVEAMDYPVHDPVTDTVSYSGVRRAVWNAQGFRDEDFRLEKEPGEIRVALVGGSATVTGSINERTFPSLVEAAFEERGRHVELYNFGLVGRASTRELFVFETEALRYLPDILLVYDGRNDAFFGSMPSFTPFWNSYDYFIVDVLNGDAGYWLPLFRVLSKFSSAPPNLAYRDPSREIPYRTHPEVVDVYRQNLESMLSLAQGRRMGAAVAFQPSIMWSERKPLTAFEQRLLENLHPRWLASMRELQPRMVGAARTLCEARGVPFRDFASVFDGRPEHMYNDDVHQSDLGNQLIAEGLVELLEPLVREAARRRGIAEAP